MVLCSKLPEDSLLNLDGKGPMELFLIFLLTLKKFLQDGLKSPLSIPRLKTQLDLMMPLIELTKILKELKKNWKRLKPKELVLLPSQEMVYSANKFSE
jgi:hypothetical protein